jgi:hypothetical protein
VVVYTNAYILCSQISSLKKGNIQHFCHNPSFGLATKARGCKVAGQEEGSSGVKRKEAQEQRQRHWKGAGQEEAQESSHTLGSLRKGEGV